jgi:hypothetical protein
MAEDVADHAGRVKAKLRSGNLALFLGAGVNLCDRPGNFEWSPNQSEQLPNGFELAQYLAGKFRYSSPAFDLARVAQYGAILEGEGELYDHLRGVFSDAKRPTAWHGYIASLTFNAGTYPLIVTTNYDLLMEHAFQHATPPRSYDLVFFDPDDEPMGRFWHRLPAGELVCIDDANTYGYDFFRERPVILKIHGSVYPENPDREGFVITEDQYIEFMARESLEKLLPPSILLRLRKYHLLFLGYSLRDWNLRVFLRRVRRNPRERRTCWAVMNRSERDEKLLWARYSVEIFESDLRDYLAALRDAP